MFISDRVTGNHDEKLKTILKYQSMNNESQLGATYRPILNQLLVKNTNDRVVKRCGKEITGIVRDFRKIVGSIVVFADPLSTASLSRILQISQDSVECKLGYLYSVLSVPSNPKFPVRLLNLSFRAFLVDSTRHDTHVFWVDEKKPMQISQLDAFN